MKKKNDDDSGVLLNACHVSLSLYLIMILIYRGVCVGYQWGVGLMGGRVVV